jgi:pimeloyl-ACP methyl ester carboxylesterase
MTDPTPEELDAQALELLDEAARPKRRVRPRLARKLHDAEDLEVQTPNGPVMAWRLGVGPASLLVHGWEDDNALWSPLIDECAAIGRAVVAFDLPGHGFSPSEAFSVEAAGQAALAVAEALGPIDSVVAHSFGCPTSIYAMAHGLKVDRAVLIGSPVPRGRAGGGRERMPGEWVRRQMERGADRKVAERAAELMAARGDNGRSAGFDAEAAIAAMTAKALIIHAMDDEQCPVENSQKMAQIWPDCELVLVDDLGHRLICQDDVILERIINFVDDFK